MNIKLFFESICKFILGVLLVGLMIFIPADTIDYFNGWLFMGLLFIPMFLTGVIMMFISPSFLKSRINAKEKEKEQKGFVALSGLMFIIGFVIAGLNYHYKWVVMPNIFVIIGIIVFVISYIIYVLVLKENVFLSRTIEVEKEQKLIDTGLYSIGRHPMYTATIFLFFINAFNFKLFNIFCDIFSISFYNC